MRKLRAWWMRFVGSLHAGRANGEFDAELESNIALHAEEHLHAGIPHDEARRLALIHLGGAGPTQQAWRDRNTLPWLEHLLQDVSYAMRGFRRNPLFTFTVVITLALGIGATTAVFSVVDRILFRPLPYTDDHQLVSVGLIAPIIPQEFMLGGSYYDWQDHQTAFTSLTSETAINECDLTEHNPAHLTCASVEANFLPTLGVSPALGRNFLPEEDRPNGPKVALISYDLWRARYNRDPSVLNRLIDIDGHQVRVVGVLPDVFELPTLEHFDLMVPEALDRAAIEPSISQRGPP